jgi:alanine-synthesizing transaminase
MSADTINQREAYSFSRLEKLPPYALGHIAERVHALRREGEHVIDLSQLNPDLNPPQFAFDKLVQASLLSHNHRYSSSAGIGVLREAFADYYRVKFSGTLDPSSEVVLTGGTKEGLSHLLLSVISPGDTALVPVPSYPVHTASVTLADGSFVGIPLWENHFSMVQSKSILTGSSEYFFSQLESRYFQTWPRPRILIISFPHNPTTTIVTRCFYERLLDFAKTFNLFVINDFAHGDLFFNLNQCVSIMSVEGATEFAVELYSISKGFSLPGWRIGCAVGNKEFLSALKKVKSYTDFGVFQPLQIAAASLLKNELCLLENGTSAVSEVSSTYKVRQEIVIEGLRKLGWSIPEVHATPFVWAELPRAFFGLGSDTFCTNLLDSTFVACSPGSGFHESLKLNVRFSLAPNESELRAALIRIEDFQNRNSK